MSMKVESHGISVKGTVHPKEDEIQVNDEKLLYAVADGVTLSSHGIGGVASQLAIYYLNKLFNQNVKETLEKLNRELCQLRLKDLSIGETTLTAAHIRDYVVEIAHVGDSSAFVTTRYAIRKITKDDSFTFGLTQVIGIDSARIHSYKEHLQREDYVILATDGVTNVMRAQEIFEVVKRFVEPKKICEAVLEKVNNTPKEYDDDKSIAIVRVL